MRLPVLTRKAVSDQPRAVRKVLRLGLLPELEVHRLSFSLDKRVKYDRIFSRHAYPSFRLHVQQWASHASKLRILYDVYEQGQAQAQDTAAVDSQCPSCLEGHKIHTTPDDGTCTTQL